MLKKKTLESRIHPSRTKAPKENFLRRRRKNTSESKDKLSSKSDKSRTEYNDDEDVTSSQSQAVNRKEIEEDLARDLADTESQSLVVSRGIRRM